jgi:hypothetical protein
MYDDEYFVSIVFSKDSHSFNDALYYKYFSELSEKQLEKYSLEEYN